MKRIISLILLLIIYINVFAQMPIMATVVDKDNRKPIADVVVQYGASINDYRTTDNKGKFMIPNGSRNLIHFQCVGYKPKVVSKTDIIASNIVEMEIDAIGLKPVVISPDDADKLLDMALANTKKKLLLDQPISYLLHYMQTKSTDVEKNEVYLKYTTTLNAKELKKNLKNERVPYTFNFIDIRRMQRADMPVSELYGAEYHASHLFTFGRSINNETKRSYSADSSLVILQVEPLEGTEGWAKGEIVINQDDMTIVSMELESIDSILENQPYKTYMSKQMKTVRKVGRFKFESQQGYNYMTECYTYYKFRVLNDKGEPEEISYFCDIDFRGFPDKSQLKKRRLSGFCQELYYLPDSTEKEFWHSDFTENTILPDRPQDKAPDKKQKGINGKVLWRTALVAVPIVAVLYFAN